MQYHEWNRHTALLKLQRSPALCLLLTGVGWAVALPVFAQSIPDTTLGNEASLVTPSVIRGVGSDRITGGAQRGQNLFHSFEQFNLPAGRGAYFDNPAGVENIFSRVTGRGTSQIFGTLGVIQTGSDSVLGSANLYFINSNGILFGPTARLDLAGSFVGTTASGVQFGNQGSFSTRDSTAPGLLTINPTALFFSEVEPGAIINQAQGNGLLTARGANLLLVGGSITFDGGRAVAQAGRVEVGGLAGTGVVQINASDNSFQLGFPTGVPRANVVLRNNNGNAFISTSSGGGVRLFTRNLSLSGGSGISTLLLPEEGGRAGDVEINATGDVDLDSSSQIAVFPVSGSNGDSGNITINARNITLVNQSGLGSITNGQGRGGSITLNAEDAIALSGGSGISNLILIQAGTTSRVSTGDIRIRGRSLTLNGAGTQISSDTINGGQGGDIRISTRRGVTLTNDAFIAARSIGNAVNGGNIHIQTSQLLVSEAARISTGTLPDFRDSAIGQGNSGDLAITADQVRLTSGGRIDSDSLRSRGNAGNIMIRSNNLELSGFTTRPNIPGLVISSISSNVAQLGIAPFDTPVRGGTIFVEVNRLDLRRGGNIATEVSSGRGQAGAIVVTASETIDISGSARPNNPSGIFASLQTNGIGSGGSIRVTTPQLNLSNGGEMNAITFSQGNAGNVLVITDQVNLQGSGTGISTQVDSDGRGNAGTLEIRTQQLRIQDNAQIKSNTFGVGNGGTLIVRANQIEMVDTQDANNLITGLATLVEEGAQGNAGNLLIESDHILLSNGGVMNSSTRGRGRAGDITINARDRIVIDDNTAGRIGGSSIRSNVAETATGNGGNILINTGSLSILRGGFITVTTAGRGNAGKITINAPQQLVIDGFAPSGFGSTITASTQQSAVGSSGRIQIDTSSFQVAQGGSIRATTANRNQGGDIFVNADHLSLGAGAVISAQSLGTGRAGNLTLNVSDRLQLTDSTIITAATRSSGGNISINSSNNSGITILNNSSITTASGGDGGNITIGGAGTVASGNSSVIARSLDQRGGNITLSPFFGDRSGNITLNADGQLAAGTILLPDTRFVQNALNQPEQENIDTNALVASSCIARGSTARAERGSFLVTGMDGLPESPGSGSTAAFSTGEVRSPDEQDFLSSQRPWQVGDPIVEPQGVYQLPDGQLVLSRECS